MFEADYLDPTKFPLTTQKGLSLQQQRMLDAINCDDLMEFLADGNQLAERQQQILEKLKQKLGKK